MLRRRFNSYNQNNIIIYQSTKREVPKITTDALGGWGANYVDSKSTWDSTSGIGHLYFDGSITRIPDYSFEQNSTMIAILYIPETVTSIGANVFYFNESGTTLRSKLQSVNFNNSIRIIGKRAFQNNRQLEKAILPNSIEYIYEYVFNACAQKLSEVTIGENFKKFLNSSGNQNENNGSGVFGLCYQLKTVHWNAINCEDFVLASKSPFTADSMAITEPPITTVTFGDKVKNIPGSLFWKCSKITGTIEIPESCERMGDRAFQACHGVKIFKIHAKNPPKIEPSDGSSFTSSDGKNAVFRYFDTSWKVMNTTIYVPSESINLYKTDSNWSIYSNIIKGM
jgi:hypothetical protein